MPMSWLFVLLWGGACTFIALPLSSSAFAAATPTEERKQQYLDLALEGYTPQSEKQTIRPLDNRLSRDNKIPMYAFRNKDIPEDVLFYLVERITSPDLTTGDFDLALLVRSLHFVDPAGQAQIQTALQDIYDRGDLQLWLTPGETHNIYWTDNHMALFLSSTWLLRSWITFRPDDEALMHVETRLRHFLATRTEYGLYEFMSTNYVVFIVGALLNLIDFAAEDDIRLLAKDLLSRIFKEWLLFLTSQGFYYPVAGRNFVRHYKTHDFTKSIGWFLTGRGPILSEEDFVGSFLSTTTMNLDEYSVLWEPSVYVKFVNGHSVSRHYEIHGALGRVDGTLHQWCAALYLYPDYVKDTDYVVDSYNLHDHDSYKEIELLLRWFWRPFLFLFALNVPGNSRGTDRSLAHITLYKNNDVALTSLEDFNVGYRGADQFIWAATVGDIAVCTQSGITGFEYEPDFGENVANSHIPQIKQVENVALIAYRPSFDVVALSFLAGFVGIPYTTQVALLFPTARFHEVLESGQWIAGRQDENYVAVWRHSVTQNHCTGVTEPCDDYYFSNPAGFDRPQVWAVVVGNSGTHTSFDLFAQTAFAGEVEEQNPGFVGGLLRFEYRTNVKVDGKHIAVVL